MWKNGKNVLAHFLQSQVSQIFQVSRHILELYTLNVLPEEGCCLMIPVSVETRLTYM